MPGSPRGTCLYAWSDYENKWVQVGTPRCSSGKICPDSSDVQVELSDRPHGEMYALSCVTAATAVADLARVAPIGPLHVGASGTCTYGWSDDLNKWVRLDANCSTGKMCPDSSDVQSDLAGYAHSGQYLLPCVSPPVVPTPPPGSGGHGQ